MFNPFTAVPAINTQVPDHLRVSVAFVIVLLCCQTAELSTNLCEEDRVYAVGGPHYGRESYDQSNQLSKQGAH